MDLIFNELSFYPLADNSQIAELYFNRFLKTFKSAREKYDFAHVRFPVEYSTQQITETLNFTEWIPTISSPIVKNLILDLIKAPFIDELEDTELEEFISGTFEVSDEGCPKDNSPFGLPIAHIKSVPSLSLDTHEFWSRNKIGVKKKLDSNLENLHFHVYNICKEGDIASNDLMEWADNHLSSKIQTQRELTKYLGYTKYNHHFSQDFLIQLFEWRESDIDKFKYILLLMKDVEKHPFTGGMGQTENLIKRGKEASKRVTHEDRLSYTLENNMVSFLACKGHYKFH